MSSSRLCRITHAPTRGDCFWTLRPALWQKRWGNVMPPVRLPTFQLPSTMRVGDTVRVQREGTPGYGAWRALR